MSMLEEVAANTIIAAESDQSGSSKTPSEADKWLGKAISNIPSWATGPLAIVGGAAFIAVGVAAGGVMTPVVLGGLLAVGGTVKTAYEVATAVYHKIAGNTPDSVEIQQTGAGNTPDSVEIEKTGPVIAEKGVAQSIDPEVLSQAKAVNVVAAIGEEVGDSATLPSNVSANNISANNIRSSAIKK